jgi:hypothetical protein
VKDKALTAAEANAGKAQHGAGHIQLGSRLLRFNVQVPTGAAAVSAAVLIAVLAAIFAAVCRLSTMCLNAWW